MEASVALSSALQLYTKLVKRRTEVEELDNYAEGKQPLAFASREWAEFHKDRYVGFSDNWCGPVATAPVERLNLTGIQPSGSVDTRDVIQAWNDWDRNDGEAQSSQGFYTSVVTKRSYTIVWGDDNDEPEFTWEHPSQVIVGYDPANPRKAVNALKSWDDGSDEFMIFYTAAALWKWRRKSRGVKVANGVTRNGLTVVGTSHRVVNADNSSWEAWQPSEDDEWPLTNPLGELNVVEWPNRPRLNGEPISDIAGTKAMQDAVNLLWAYLFGAADHASMPGRVVMGQESPKIPILDKDGQKIGEKDVPIKEMQHGRFLWLTGQNAKIDQFDAAKLDVFTDVIEIAVGHIAAQTRTPSHYLINAQDVPAAGYELAEAGLVNKVKEFQRFSQAPARKHFRLMASVRGNDRLAEALRLANLAWANAETRSDAQLADALLKKRQIGYPFEYLLELDGLGPTERQRVMEMAAREQDDPYLTHLREKDAADVDAEPSSFGD